MQEEIQRDLGDVKQQMKDRKRQKLQELKARQAAV